MKILIYTVSAIVILIVLALVALSLSSRKQPVLGLINGQLRACPATPNCVCSEHHDDKAFIEPLTYTSTAEDAWRRMKQAIAETGGVILTEQGGYLHARYETRFLHFIDDVELRLDDGQHVMHVRSASRAGHSDLGMNRKRVTRIRNAFAHLSTISQP